MIAKNPIVSAVSFRMWRMVLSLCCVGRMGLAPLLVVTNRLKAQSSKSFRHVDML